MGHWAHYEPIPGRLCSSARLCPEPRMNFLLIAMVVLIWFIMNHHNLVMQPP
jgi:hypothetical protein